jgi:serine/threonine protein kinase
VRKELKRKDEGQVEVKNLAILKHIKHPNITELLSSYTYNGKVNFIFPLADSGTLADLLKSDRSTTMFTSDETILLALTGLCSALEHVHHYMEQKIDLVLNGFHHDLRQPNVLIAGTTFLLADFGLSRFKDLSEESDTTFRDPWGTTSRQNARIYQSLINYTYGGKVKYGHSVACSQTWQLTWSMVPRAFKSLARKELSLPCQA